MPRSHLARLEALEDRVLLAFDPPAIAQEMLEHVNRMRMDPQGELDVLFVSLDPLVSSDPSVTEAINIFADPTPSEIRTEWPSLVPAPPLAWHESLYSAAVGHSEDMIQYDEQLHEFPNEPTFAERLTAAGYTTVTAAAENI